ncbi:Bcr/CflA family multidrug efflux MFS transporter [Actinoalloteichus sp. AHMU CJ021]|uniref:Bcr/CflA family multidrug efflux MFS transporter n=1 Tax=Actinoalloteichus sp. AHMU CJ021 TaxID=2072503 RepID=UPI0026CA00C1
MRAITPSSVPSEGDHAPSVERQTRPDQTTERTEEPFPISRWRLAAILGALSALGPLSIDTYLPAFPAIASDFDTTTSQVQLSLTACLLGLALGQIVAGPLSDALGRRRPLLTGLFVYVLSSAACAVALTAPMLTGARFVQGLSGAASLVIARAIVRDRYSGIAAAKFFSMLMLVTGAAPVLAPLIGSQLLLITSWQGVFVVLAGYGVVLLLLAGLRLPETLPPERRRSGGVRDTLRTYRSLLANRFFLGCALSSGLAFSAVFCYISASPFVLQDIYGVSPQTFGLLFGLNSVGIVVAGQVNGLLVSRFDQRTLLITGLCSALLGAIALLVVVTTDVLGLAGVLPALFLVVSSIGLVMPNGTTLALADHPDAAGSASALLGMLQFTLGGLAAPLVGLGGSGSAVPMALVMVLTALAALGVFLTLTRGRRPLA